MMACYLKYLVEYSKEDNDGVLYQTSILFGLKCNIITDDLGLNVLDSVTSCRSFPLKYTTKHKSRETEVLPW